MRTYFNKLILAAGLVQPAQHRRAEGVEHDTGRFFGSCLLALGYVDPEKLRGWITEATDLPWIPGNAVLAAEEALAANIPTEIVARFRVVPFGLERGVPMAALYDPDHLQEGDLQAFVERSGCKLHLCDEAVVERAIARLYPQQARTLNPLPQAVPKVTAFRLRGIEGAAKVEFEIDTEVEERELGGVWKDATAFAEALAHTPEADRAILARRLERGLALTGATNISELMELAIPVAVPGFVPKERECTPLEQSLYALSDGKNSIHEIMALAKLSLFETVTILTSLNEKGGVYFRYEEPQEDAAGAGASRYNSISDVDLNKLLDRAGVAFQEGLLDHSREYADRAVDHAPESRRSRQLQSALNDPSFAATRATILLKHGIDAYRARAFRAATQFLRNAIVESDCLVTAHHRLAMAIMRTTQDFAEAALHCRRALELSGGNALYRRNLKIIERLAAQRGQAIQELARESRR